MDSSQTASQYQPRKKHTVDRPASCRLAPLNTSYTFTSHPSSSTASSSIASSISSASQLLPSSGRRSLAYIPTFTKTLSPSATIFEEKTVMSPIQFRFAAHDQNHGSSHSVFAIPTTPPLSARSAAFLITLRQTFLSAVDAYAHRRFNHSEKSPPCQRTHFSDSKSANDFEGQHDMKRKPPITPRRKLVAAIFGTLSMTSLVLTIFFTSGHRILQPRTTQHIIMGGSGSVIVFAAMLMLVLRRSIKEILAMAAVSVTVCQCVMADFNSVL
jgi:hypothetical protein